MGQFIYNFSLMLLHSLWQSALLLLLYKSSLLLIKGPQPFFRRNLLFYILLMQLCISAVTFIIFASDLQSLQPTLLQIPSILSEVSMLKDAVPVLFSLYVLVIVYKTTLLFYHWNRFKTKCHDSLLKASVDHRLFAINKASELGIRRKVKLWYSDAISSPITFGFLKPVILLPLSLFTQLSIKETEMLILHELTHIKHNDYVLNFILIASETIFFFNPFIKKMCALVKLEREKNCDVEVLQSSYSSLTYAEALLKIARFKSDVNRLHLAATSDNKQLLDRVIFFTSEKNLRLSKSRYAFISYALIALVFILNLFTINQIQREPGNGGYEYTASTVPGYNAYSFTASFSDADNLPAVSTDAVVRDKANAASSNRIQKPKTRYTNVDAYALSNTLEPREDIDIEDNQFLPVTNVEPQESKEFIFHEESSAGNKVTRAYKMVLVNGKWIVQPLWMYSESKILPDSLISKKDSLPRPFNIIQ